MFFKIIIQLSLGISNIVYILIYLEINYVKTSIASFFCVIKCSKI